MDSYSKSGDLVSWLSTFMMVQGHFEFEVPLELAVATDMINLLREGCVVSKTRHIVLMGGLRWEIDEFGGQHDGLVIAELEEQKVPATLPDFIGEEITRDSSYSNLSLSRGNHVSAAW